MFALLMFRIFSSPHLSIKWEVRYQLHRWHLNQAAGTCEMTPPLPLGRGVWSDAKTESDHLKGKGLVGFM